MTRRSGFVGLIGRPNTGKSTLLNYLIDAKLAAVSNKPQTTRGVIRGIMTTPKGQIVYLDTPGHHDPRDGLGNWMISEIKKALESSDLIYWVVTPGHTGTAEEKIFELLKGSKTPVILAVNQIDKFPREAILPVIHFYQDRFTFKEFIPISAKTGEQVPLLVEKTYEHLPEGPDLYPEDQISPQQERLFVQEIIREKIFRFTGEEIPYASAVVIETFKDRSDKLTDIQATIMIEKDSQKAIIIGKGGRKLKEIGKAARLDIEKFIGKKVFLELWVKVNKDWKEDREFLKKIGYD